MNRNRRQRGATRRAEPAGGFTLIEVLVTLLILAIGLLGIAALQFRGLQYNQDAYVRSQVSFLAYDISDRMRLNRANIANYAPDNYTAQAIVDGADNFDCDQSLGSDKDNDLGCWHNYVDRAMPPGSSADISTDGTYYTVTLTWADRQGGSHVVNYTFQ